MDAEHIKILNSCRFEIVHDMDIASVLDHLIGIKPTVLLPQHEKEIMVNACLIRSYWNQKTFLGNIRFQGKKTKVLGHFAGTRGV